MNNVLYSEIIAEYFFKPIEEEISSLSLNLTSKSNRVYEVKQQLNEQEYVVMYWQISPTGKVLQTQYEVVGNPVLIALARWLCQQVKGLTLKQIKTLDPLHLIASFAIPKVKEGSAYLIIEIIESFIQLGSVDISPTAYVPRLVRGIQ